MVREEFSIPDYIGGPLPNGLEALQGRISLALASAHVRGVEGAAKAEAPVRIGRLRSSIRAHLAGAGSGVLEATAPYAKYLHHGTGLFGPGRTPILIEPRGKKALSWPGAKHPVKRVRQSGIRPRDFLRRAVMMYFPALRAFGVSLRMEVVEIFRRNYMDLRKAGEYLRNKNEELERNNQKKLDYGNTDKYFHCKANCEAAQLGYLAEAVLANYVKEEFDLTIDNWFFGGEHTLGDSIKDMGVNLKGLGSGMMAPSTPCGASCSGYRPDWLPKDLW